MVGVLSALAAIVALSFMAYWKPHGVLFAIIAGMSLMTGLEWYNVQVTNLGLSISVMLIGYSFLAIGFSYRVILTSRR